MRGISRRRLAETTDNGFGERAYGWDVCRECARPTSSGESGRVERPGGRGDRPATDVYAADGRSNFQLQRAGISGVRDVAVRYGNFGKERVSRRARRGRSSDGVGGELRRG